MTSSKRSSLLLKEPALIRSCHSHLTSACECLLQRQWPPCKHISACEGPSCCGKKFLASTLQEGPLSRPLCFRREQICKGYQCDYRFVHCSPLLHAPTCTHSQQHARFVPKAVHHQTVKGSWCRCMHCAEVCSNRHRQELVQSLVSRDSLSHWKDCTDLHAYEDICVNMCNPQNEDEGQAATHMTQGPWYDRAGVSESWSKLGRQIS